MDKYNFSHYQEADQMFVQSVSIMADTDQIKLQLQDMEGEPLKKVDGSLVEAFASKSQCDIFLTMMRDREMTLNELLIEAIVQNGKPQAPSEET